MVENIALAREIVHKDSASFHSSLSFPLFGESQLHEANKETQKGTLPIQCLQGPPIRDSASVKSLEDLSSQEWLVAGDYHTHGIKFCMFCWSCCTSLVAAISFRPSFLVNYCQPVVPFIFCTMLYGLSRWFNPFTAIDFAEIQFTHSCSKNIILFTGQSWAILSVPFHGTMRRD